MSPIIVGWQSSAPMGDARVHELMEEVARRYQPFFRERLDRVGLWQGNQGLLHIDVPRDTDDGLHRTDDRICCRTSRPTDADPHSSTTGPLGAATLYDRLVSSSGAVRADAVATLEPPFTFCWFDRRSARIGLVHDGLGLDQLFVSLTPAGLAFSNRIWPILRLLGEPPILDVEAWRYWFCLGWFPDLSAPVRNVRALGPSEIIVGDSLTVTSSSADALARWIGHGSGQDPATVMPRAAQAVRDRIRRSRPRTGGFEADLTGGLDSRTVAAVLSREGVPCRFYTGGSRWSPDVALARRIARQLGLEWTRLDDLAPPDPDSLSSLVEGRLRRFTCWTEGLVEPKRLCTFPDSPAPTREGVYLGGGSSEISRGPHYRRIFWRNSAPAFDLERAVAYFTHAAPDMLAPPAADALVERVRHQFGEGASLGLREWALTDHFHLRHKVRRWQGGHLAANLFDADVLPFVIGGHISLAFAMTPRAKAGSEFQRFLLQQNAPAVLRIPVTSAPSHGRYLRFLLWLERRRNRGNSAGWMGWVRGPGRASVERALSSDGPLWEILDRGRVIKKWHGVVAGTSPNLNFPLSLLAFSTWHSTMIEES